MSNETRKISAAALESFIARAFTAIGITAAEAKNIAELMTRADVNGADGHGVFRLPQYIRRIKGGAVTIKPKIAVGVPAGEEPPIVLDMATTVAAYGKVKTAAQRGETMPEGWMIDRMGKALTDPTRANEGLLLPIGGYKGYGLALVFGLLAGTLNGAAMGRDVVDFNNDDTTPTNTGHAIVAINVAMFRELAEFKA